MARPKKFAAKPLSELVGKVLEPVIARRAGMTLDLMAAWPEIVGPKYAEQTRAEKISWNRKADSSDPFEPATLVVACEGSIALFLQHDNDQILERVNAFFGFDAIGRIKILQKPVIASQRGASKFDQPKGRQLNQDEQKRLDAILEGIEDDALRERLNVLGKAIFVKDTK